MQILTIALLHQHPQSLLTTINIKIKVLNLVAFLIREATTALNLFLQGHLKSFDPHVGETSCQIRAYRLFLLSSRSADTNFINNLNTDICRLKSALKLITSHLENMHTLFTNNLTKVDIKLLSTQKLTEFLKDHDAFFLILDDTRFLLQAYFLTKFKKVLKNGNSYIDYENICKQIGIGKKFSKKIVHYYQCQIALDSTSFIFNLLNDLSDYKYLVTILEKLNFRDDDDRSVIPCYLGVKILLSHMLLKNCPIFLSVKRIYKQTNIDLINFLFIPNRNKTNYCFVSDLRSSELKINQQSGVIIEGIVSYKDLDDIESSERYKKRFLSENLITVILSNMANHPQYSGNKLSFLKNDPYQAFNELDSLFPSPCVFNNKTYEILRQETISMKTYGKNLGCCESNPSLFYINHIYCNILEYYLIEKEAYLEEKNDILMGIEK